MTNANEQVRSEDDSDACRPNKERPQLQYKHAWRWKWDIAGQWTDFAICDNCGLEREMRRDQNIDGYTGKWRGEPIR